MAEIKVEAQVLKQNDFTLYSFALNSEVIKKDQLRASADNRQP